MPFRARETCAAGALVMVGCAESSDRSGRAGSAVDPELPRGCARRSSIAGRTRAGIHRDGRVGLGIQRLRVIDLATGDQPIFNEDRSVAVVLNGEIYNYRELRDELERARPHASRPQGDTEVIAHLYEEHGADCVTPAARHVRLRAVGRAAAQRLLLARDRVGKKPLVLQRCATAS